MLLLKLPFRITAIGTLGFPIRLHATLLTLNWHSTALGVSWRSKQAAVVMFVTVEQVPQSKLILYCTMEQAEMAEVQLNSSFSV